MANLESSWESSVVKLAQMGNLRAITFWLNRYLVPQGLCAQVIPEQPGSLLIRVVCHRLPDCNRLVHFIHQQFLELNSELIRELRITAQPVGATELLWERSVPIRFPVQPTPPVSRPASEVATATAGQTRPTAAPGFNSIQFTPRPIPTTQPQPAQQAGPQALRKKSAPPKRGKRVQPARPAVQMQALLQDWTARGLDQVEDAKAGMGRAVWRSQRWFKSKPPEVQTLLVSGFAVTTVAIGCGLQVISQQIGTPSAGLGEAFLTDPPKPHVDQSGTVKASLESVPVIKQAVQNPADPAVTLVFASNAALGQTSSLAVYQQSDLLMSNLDNPLAAPSPNASGVTTSASPVGSPAPEIQPEIKTVAAKTNPTDATTLAPSNLAESGTSSNTAVQDSAGMLVSSASYISDSVKADSTDAAESIPAAHATTLDELVKHGVDVVNLAAQPLTTDGALPQTLNALSQKAIYPIGAGQNSQAARRPQIFEIKGEKIAILGYADSDLNPASDRAAGLNPAINSQIEADIKAIRDQVDWVIVSYHWNKVVRASPEESQITLAHAAIDHGADLVVGYAPQIMQGAEMYGGRAIVYSLGDDINEPNDSASTYSTAALKVTLQQRNMQVEFLPIQVQQNQAAIATGEVAAKITEYLQQASSLFDHPLRSPLTLDARLRVSLPTAPDSDLPPTDPFVSYPSPKP
ncbi:MAG TPA: CapA family protein [Coleofasciculaceae cyanobacterium]